MAKPIRINMIASRSTLDMKVFNFGNSREYLIEVKGNGGQFEYAEVFKTENGFILKIIGTWEMDEFVQALNKAYFCLTAVSDFEQTPEEIDVSTRLDI